MEATRRLTPQEVVEKLAEALTQIGITFEEAEQRIKNAIKGIMEIAKKITDILQTKKRDRVLFVKREAIQRAEVGIKIKLYERIKLKHFKCKYKPP